MTETHKGTFTRWLADGHTWIGVYENQDLGSRDIGRRVCFPFDDGLWEMAVVGQTRAPDHKEIGLGWRYILVAKTRDADEANRVMNKLQMFLH